ITALLDAGADVGAKDAKGRTAAEHAVAAGHPELAKLLLDRGADASDAVRAAASAERHRTIDGYAIAVAQWLERVAGGGGGKARGVRGAKAKRGERDLSLGAGWTVRSLRLPDGRVDLARTPPP